MANELKTYGDLKKVIKSISVKQKLGKLGDVSLDVAVGLLPGADLAKNTYSFIKAAFSKPDTVKTKTWLDKLDIDDDTKDIVDDTIENGFLKDQAKKFDSEPDDKPLENDFNMNAKLVKYIGDKHNGRTVTGIKEQTNMKKMKYRLTKNIKEVEAKIPSSISTISKDLADQGSNFKQITTKDKMVQLLDTIVAKMKENNPEFVEGSQFKQAVLVFYNKYK
jgi:hypothetical protein